MPVLSMRLIRFCPKLALKSSTSCDASNIVLLLASGLSNYRVICLAVFSDCLYSLQTGSLLMIQSVGRWFLKWPFPVSSVITCFKQLLLNSTNRLVSWMLMFLTRFLPNFGPEYSCQLWQWLTLHHLLIRRRLVSNLETGM